jgi:hypothetical protein
MTRAMRRRRAKHHHNQAIKIGVRACAAEQRGPRWYNTLPGDWRLEAMAVRAVRRHWKLLRRVGDL